MPRSAARVVTAGSVALARYGGGSAAPARGAPVAAAELASMTASSVPTRPRTPRRWTPHRQVVELSWARMVAPPAAGSWCSAHRDLVDAVVPVAAVGGPVPGQVLEVVGSAQGRDQPV